MSNLGTIVTAMITPFDDRGEVDYREAGRLAKWLAERGNDGLVIAGSTGEGQTLTPDERVRMFAAVKEAVGDGVAVIVNAGSNDTRDSVHSIKAAEKAGADAILAVVPYYNKPPQSGMIAHFGVLAEATPLPVVIYNIPGRTAANMLPETLLEIARRHKNIAGVKESSGDLNKSASSCAIGNPASRFGPATIICFYPALQWARMVSLASHRTFVRASTSRW